MKEAYKMLSDWNLQNGDWNIIKFILRENSYFRGLSLALFLHNGDVYMKNNAVSERLWNIHLLTI